MPQVLIVTPVHPEPLKFEAKMGESLLDLALTHDLPIAHACGGFCACTTCHVKVIAGADQLSTPEEEEIERLEAADGSSPQSRLACQSLIKGDVTFQIVNWEE